MVNALKESSWGTFTIAMTIPVALFVGLWMYRIRPGQIAEASIIGVLLVLAAVVLGGQVPGSSLAPYFTLSGNGMIIALAAYGFIASVLPVWMLLCPRDYLSSYLKIGTIALLIVGVLVVHPHLKMPAVTQFIPAAARSSRASSSRSCSSPSPAAPSPASTRWSARAPRPR